MIKKMKAFLQKIGRKTNGKIKKIRKRWRNFQRKRADNKKLFEHAKLFLKKGIYYISKEERVIKKVDRHTFWNNFFYLCFLIKSFKCKEPMLQIEKVEFLELGGGCAKVIFFNQNYAYGFYKSKREYFDAKQRYLEFSPLFTYPSIKESFIDQYQCVVMDRVRGKLLCDDEHNQILLRKMLGFAIYAPIKRDPIYGILYLQHGDVYPNNVLWDKQTFLFIDLDSISFYPPLFDIFRFLVTFAGMTELTSIINLLNENPKELKAIFEKAEIVTQDNPWDILLYNYLLFYYRTGRKEDYVDFRFLTIENTVDFPKTNKLLRTIYEE